jgi:type II secretory pathway component PulF
VPTYAYDAVDRHGKRRRGQSDSASHAALTRTLAQRGLVVVRISDHASAAAAPNIWRGQNRRVAVLEVTRALAALLPAGMPLARALSATSGLAASDLATVLAEVRARVERGESFADALAAHAAYFPAVYVGLVRAGERSGDVAGSLARLSEQLEREEALRAKLLSASIYPLILALAGGLSVTVLLLFVLPRFAEMLSGAGASLPRSTALLLSLSASARIAWPIFAAAPIIAAMVPMWARTTEQGQRVVSSALLALPIVRGLRMNSLAARFARLTGVLLAGGAPLLIALDDAAGSMGDPTSRDDTVRIRARVREGGSLTAAVGESRLFPPLLAQLIAVGEESGKLQQFLLKAAEIFEERSDRARQRLVALAEPAMIVAFGGVIGFVALSLLQAIYGVNAAAFR